MAWQTPGTNYPISAVFGLVHSLYRPLPPRPRRLIALLWTGRSLAVLTPLFSSSSLLSMSCCGTSRSPVDRNSAQAPLSPHPISHQPSPHPGAVFPEKTQWLQQPSIPSPPLAHPYNSLNGHHSPKPHSFVSGGSNSPPPMQQQFTSFTHDPYNQSSLTKPNPSYVGGSLGMLSPTFGITSVTPSVSGEFSPLSDEGKMSISIDFGEHLTCLIHIHVLISRRDNVLGCGQLRQINYVQR